MKIFEGQPSALLDHVGRDGWGGWLEKGLYKLRDIISKMAGTLLIKKIQYEKCQ